MDLPSDRVVVPLTGSTSGLACVRTARRPDGQRVGVAFTDRLRLQRALGSACPAVPMSLTALHTMLRPLGIDVVQVDPELVRIDVPLRQAV